MIVLMVMVFKNGHVIFCKLTDYKEYSKKNVCVYDNKLGLMTDDLFISVTSTDLTLIFTKLYLKWANQAEL